MSDTPAAFSWIELLNKFSRDFLERPDIEDYGLPESLIKSGWLGYPGATEEQIRAAEARLGRSLPPSYRAFLKTSNGFRNFGSSIDKMWSVEEIDWFHVRNRDWIDAYLNPVSYGYDPDLGKSRDDKQDFSGFRLGDLRYCLEISATGDSAIMLLNPQVADDTGEWEAVFFANWIPGTYTYEDFREMAVSQIDTFKQISAQDKTFFGDRVLWEKGLSGLIELFNDKIDTYPISRVTPANADIWGITGAHHIGLRDGMVAILSQIQELNQQSFDPTQLRAELQKLAESARAEAEQGENESRTNIFKGLASMQAMFNDALFKGEKSEEMTILLQRSGRWQGLHMSASLIESFLRTMTG